MPLTPISIELQKEATSLLRQYENQLGVDTNPLEKVSKGQRISAEMLAIAKAQKQPYSSFLMKHRQQVTTQLFIDNRLCSAVTLIVFRGTDGQQYILLNANRGILSDIEPQWSTIHVRVENDEAEIVGKATYEFSQAATKYAPDLTPFVAAATRAGHEYGLDIQQFPIKQILPIKRGRYGLAEAGADKYRTEHICVVLEDCDPQRVKDALKANAFGDKIHCVPVSQYLSDTVNISNQTYFTSEGVTLPIRASLLKFSRNLFSLNVLDMKAHTDSDPIENRKCNAGSDFAIFKVFRSDIPEDLDFSLTLYPKNNRRPTNQVYEIARKTGENPEDIAANSLTSERVLLREVIAQIVLYVLVIEGSFDSMVWDAYKQAISKAENPPMIWSDEMESEKIAYLEKIAKQQKNYTRGTFCQLNETDEEIAKGLVSDKHRTQHLTDEYYTIVQGVIQESIKSEKWIALPHYPLNQRITCGIMGPVASGKSASVKQVKQDYPNLFFNLLGSDEFINILLANQNTNGIDTHRGWLMLSEAWYIKERFLTLLRTATQAGFAPCIIYETLNVRNIPLENAVADNGKFVAYMNTADASGAIERMETRGKKENRYVDPQTTLNSYQAISRYFVSNITYLMSTIGKNDVRIILRDTDALFYQGQGPKPEPRLVEITFHGTPTLLVHNLSGLMKFFDRATKTIEVGKEQATWEIAKGDANHARVSLASLIKLFPIVRLKKDDLVAQSTLAEMNIPYQGFL